ncbi:MAG: glycosyl hydrolase family 28 protein, partial [Myxococcota bacterium]|nr:glycosyl hydrolase family 28 protein [Myxococcota bacterium]
DGRGDRLGLVRYDLAAIAVCALSGVACGTTSSRVGADGAALSPSNSDDASSEQPSGMEAASSTDGTRTDGGEAAIDEAAAQGNGANDAVAEGGAPNSVGNDGGEASATANPADASPTLPPEPIIPPACATLVAAKTQANGTLADETNPDTARIQAAIDACPAGRSVRLTVGGASDAFLSGPLTLAAGVTLWIDRGATLFASRDPRDFDVAPGTCGTFANNSSAGCKPFIAVTVPNAAIVGDGVIDGRGGEPMLGATTTWWDVAQGAKTAGMNQSCPTLIQVKGAQNFTLYKITLHNSPNFHVTLGSKGFVVWGVTIITPSAATNSLGRALTASYARNTDGIDPSGASDGYIVFSKISDGDDQIAIKAGGAGPVSNVVIAHNHFGSGHGMSIGSETANGVSNIAVYDLSIDGSLPNNGMSNLSGIRIKSDASRGGLVSHVTYTDVCVRSLANPIFLDTHYTTAPGSLIPTYTGIVIRDFHSLASTIAPAVMLNGYDASHPLGIALDDVVVDGIVPSKAMASFANVRLGPGSVNFTPAGSGVAVTNTTSGPPTPNACAGKWVSF